MIKKVLEIIKIIFMVGLVIGVILFCAYSDTHYSRTGFIKHSELPNLYTFIDSNGNVWEFVDEDIIIPYNTVVQATAKMFTNNTTDDITDDMILEIKIDSISEK